MLWIRIRCPPVFGMAIWCFSFLSSRRIRKRVGVRSTPRAWSRLKSIARRTQRSWRDSRGASTEEIPAQSDHLPAGGLLLASYLNCCRHMYLFNLKLQWRMDISVMPRYVVCRGWGLCLRGHVERHGDWIYCLLCDWVRKIAFLPGPPFGLSPWPYSYSRQRARRCRDNRK